MGYRKVASYNASITDNLSSKRADIVAGALEMFDKTVGVFRMRFLESISPLFWIEFFIFLPRRIVNYLGGEPDRIPVKLLQLIYWVAAPLLIAFRTEFYEFIITLIEHS